MLEKIGEYLEEIRSLGIANHSLDNVIVWRMSQDNIKMKQLIAKIKDASTIEERDTIINSLSSAQCAALQIYLGNWVMDPNLGIIKSKNSKIESLKY